MTIADAPTPRRTRRPRWLDVRVIGGVLLLVASVVVGAKVIGASSRTGPVWAAAHDLAAGTVLAAGDLVKVDVNLGDAGSAYLDAHAAPDGQMLNTPVHTGELLPAAALGPVGDGRIVSVSVSPERMAPGVAHGSVIDLYLTSGGDRVSGDSATTRLLRSGVTVQRVTAPASGGLSAATSNRYQVALLLTPTAADALVRSLPAGEPLVVLRTGESAGDPAPGRGVAPGDGAAPAPGSAPAAGDGSAPGAGDGSAPGGATASPPSPSPPSPTSPSRTSPSPTSPSPASTLPTSTPPASTPATSRQAARAGG